MSRTTGERKDPAKNAKPAGITLCGLGVSLATFAGKNRVASYFDIFDHQEEAETSSDNLRVSAVATTTASNPYKFKP